jgi:CheY-like chemotaxis protein
VNTSVLWVEDDADDVFLIGRAIRKAGLCQPTLVRDGGEAVAYLSGSGPYADRSVYPLPKLILLDLKLPKMSGFEVLSWIRERSQVRRLPVVMFTSSNEACDIDRAYGLGANAYLTKSVDHQHLVEALRCVRAFWLDLNLNPTPRVAEFALLPGAGADPPPGRGRAGL